MRCVYRPQSCHALIAFALTLTLSFGDVAWSASVGDRLVLSINHEPYTQRQVEVYIHVKESLRKTSDGNVRTIAAANWHDALTVFAEDMIVLQESQRLGSFQAPDQAFDRYLRVVQDKIAQGAALRSALTRLGVDDVSLQRTLEQVLRIAAFRRSRDKQEQQRRGPQVGERAAEGKWLAELKSRATVRRYADAATYIEIHPVVEGRHGRP